MIMGEPMAQSPSDTIAEPLAMAHKRPLDGEGDHVPPRKKFKTSDLPLPAVTRSAIDGLVHTFKKKGEFDRLRKHLWGNFSESEAKSSFTSSLTELAESEIERDSSLLARDRGKAATLIEGAVDRTDIYKTVEVEIDGLINGNLAQIERALRAVRRDEIGEEVASQEERRGNKTEEDYAREAEVRHRERERKREIELEKQREIEREKERIQELELERQREEERRKEKEQRDCELEQERKREAEREREKYWRRERQGKREQEKDKNLGYWGGDEKAGRIEALKDIEADIDKRRISLPPEEDEALQEEALNLLLKEGQELAAKARQRPEPERSASLEPPARRGHRPHSRHKAIVQDDGSRDLRRGKSPRRERSRDSHRATTRHSRGFDLGIRERSRERSRDRGRRDDENKRRRDHRSRSRSRVSTPRDDDRRKGDRGVAWEAVEKEVWKAQQQARREREAEVYKKAQREQRDGWGRRENAHTTSNARSRSRSPRQESLIKPRHRVRSRSPISRRRNHSTDRSRSRTPAPRRRRRSRSRSPAVGRHQKRSTSRHSRSRSRSGMRRRRNASRSKSPEIDSYRPAGGSRKSTPPVSRRRPRSREREKPERRGFVEIDRYVPGGGGSASKKERSRSRQRERSSSPARASRRRD